MRHPRTFVLTLVFGMAAAADAHAQRFIYNGKGDQTAQEAVTAAGKVTSDALFDLMLRNVDAQSKVAADTEVAFVEQQMRAKLQAFFVWHHKNAVPARPLPAGRFLAGVCLGSVRCELESVQRRLSAALPTLASAQDIAARLARIETRQKELVTAIKALEAAKKSDDPAIVHAFALLEDPGRDVLDHAKKLVDLVVANGTLNDGQEQFAKGVAGALNEIEKGLDQALALYGAVKGIWDGYRAVSVDPASLRPPQERTDLQLLAVERDHLRANARILARKQVEVGAALAQVTDVLTRLRAMKLDESTELIEATLATATATAAVSLATAATTPPVTVAEQTAAAARDRDRVFQIVRVLHDAAAVVAQVDAAAALADFRLADQERRYSIRQSAVNTSTYDLTIQAAVQRLATYWKGGIKPSELAQFAFFLSNTVAIPVIAAKQE